MLKSLYIIIFLFKEFALEHVAFNVQNKFYVTFKHLPKKKKKKKKFHSFKIHTWAN